MKGAEWYQEDAVAESYEDKRFSRGGRLIDRREREAVLNAIEPVENKRVLEIACGTGRFTVMLAERGANIVGLDISDAMLAQGRQKARQSNVADRIDFIRGDAGRLPFPDDYFDAVVAMRFFHLADTPREFLAELARVASDTVFFDTFNGWSFRVLYNWALPMGSRLYNRGEVESLIADAGLELTHDDHDFLFPYGFYRQVPNAIAGPFRQLDTAVGSTGPGRRLASVSYWETSV